MTNLKGVRRTARTAFHRGLAATSIAASILLGAILGPCALTASGESVRGATYTNLTAETRAVGGHTVATLSLSVAGDSDGNPTGVVTLMDGEKNIAAAALNPNGTVTFTVEGLTAGDHNLKAIYSGDASHEESTSNIYGIHAEASTTPDFILTISSTSLNVAAPGGSAALNVTVTPANGFTGFLSLSCSGPSVTSGAPGGTALPFGVSCTYAPANLEVVTGTTANPTGAQNANLSIQTTAPGASTSLNSPPAGLPGASDQGMSRPLVLAVLLPGIIGLGLISRKRNLLSRGALLTMLGVITLLGTSACAQRYSYFHHPPTYNPGTLAGVYTITVTAQTSNGVTATEHSQELTLTVK